MRAEVVALIASALAACSQSVTPQVPEGGTARSVLLSAHGLAEPSVPVYALGGSAGISEVIGYGVPGFTKPAIIKTPNVKTAAEIGVDSRGLIYVADVGYDTDRTKTSITEYKVGHHGSLRTVKSGIAYPYGIAVSGRGELYVANAYAGAYGDVAVYQKNSVKPGLIITSGINAPDAVAVDASGFVYVGNQEPSPDGNVQEYAPGTKNPAVTVTDGIFEPTALAVDASEDLYVANWPNEITEYGAHSANLTRTLALSPPQGFITSLAVDGLGDVYAGLAWNPGVGWYGKMVIYGPTGQTPLKTIPLGGGHIPTSIASDDSGDLYALVGSGFGGLGAAGYVCSDTCSLWEYSDGWKTRSLIARSKRGSEHFLTGPIVAGLK
jgi:sugar lactone lactonase YvrE